MYLGIYTNTVELNDPHYHIEEMKLEANSVQLALDISGDLTYTV